jgi:transcriptional regulator with XRE-family HTH domain
LAIPSKVWPGAHRVGFTVRMTMAMEHGGFAGQLRRWRALRRMSQLDVAIRADTTQRHLSFLEQGRSKPGRTMVLRLAESLDLTLRERNELLLVAGYAPAFPESDLEASSLDAVRDAIEHVLAGHQPYPAVVVRPHGILVAANPAFGILTDGAAPSLLTPPVNVLRLALHPEGLGGRVLNLPEWGRHITESLRSRLARNPDPRLDELITELEGYLPPYEPGPDHLGFAVPLSS